MEPSRSVSASVSSRLGVGRRRRAALCGCARALSFFGGLVACALGPAGASKGEFFEADSGQVVGDPCLDLPDYIVHVACHPCADPTLFKMSSWSGSRSTLLVARGSAPKGAPNTGFRLTPLCDAHNQLRMKPQGLHHSVCGRWPPRPPCVRC